MTGVSDLIGSFPWLIGDVMNFVAQLLFAAWFVILGVRVLSVAKE